MSAPRLGRATLTYAGGELAARGAWFALVLALGCILPQRQFGAWGLLVAAVGLLEIGLTAGLHSAAVRWLYDRGEDAYRGVLFTLLLLWLATSASLALVLALLGSSVFPWLTAGMPWRPHGHLVLMLAWLGAASAVTLAMLAARQRPGAHTGLRVATVLGPAVGVLLALALGARSAGLVLAGQLLGAAPVALLALGLGFAAARPRLLWREIGPILAFALPVLPHMMAQWVLSWSDRWLLGSLLDLEAVAVYHLAYLPALGVLLLGGALNRAWYPLLYRDLELLDRTEPAVGGRPFTARGAPDEPTSAASRATWARLREESEAVLLAMACAGAGVALWAGELLRVLPTKDYEGSPGLVALVVTGTTLGLLCLLPHNLLYHHRRTAIIPALTALAAGANLGLNLLLIPPMGPAGAALATLLAYLLLAALFWWAAHRVARPLVRLDGLLRLFAAPGAVSILAVILSALPLAWPLRLLSELLCILGLAWALWRGGALPSLGKLLRAER